MTCNLSVDQAFSTDCEGARWAFPLVADLTLVVCTNVCSLGLVKL